MSMAITPHMTVQQIGELLEELKRASTMEISVRIETIAGKPVGYIERHPQIPLSANIALLKRQAD